MTISCLYLFLLNAYNGNWQLGKKYANIPNSAQCPYVSFIWWSYITASVPRKFNSILLCPLSFYDHILDLVMSQSIYFSTIINVHRQFYGHRYLSPKFPHCLVHTSFVWLYYDHVSLNPSIFPSLSATPNFTYIWIYSLQITCLLKHLLTDYTEPHFSC